MKRLFMVMTITIALLATGCNSNKTSDSTNATDSTPAAMNSEKDNEERNKEIALASIKAFSDRNADEGLKNITPDAVDYGDGSMPPIKGSDSIKTMAKMFLASFPDYKGENLMALADGDHVAVVGDWSGTFKKDLMGIKATNKQFKLKDVDIFTFNSDGKITEHRSIQSMQNVFGPMNSSMNKKH